MKTQHTPSPWQLTIGENDAAIHTDVTIARIEDEASSWEANARLISAAPELLQIAKGYVLFCELNGLDGVVLDSARSAIAKAEGAK